MGIIALSGSFDNIKSREVRLLEEAAKFGEVHVYLWSDKLTHTITGKPPRFPLEERQYLLDGVRYVSKIRSVEHLSDADKLPEVVGIKPKMWIVPEEQDTSQKRAYCLSKGIMYMVLEDADLMGFPIQPVDLVQSSKNTRVLVTGCYDWFHSGHVRFFEETSQLGDLYVVVGHDENVRLLKGEGHPMFPEDERRYLVGSIRFVKQALVSSGRGWMDAEPEIESIRPHIYAVNEDGDKPEKRQFCKEHGLEYVVLKRKPAPGLPRRESSHLRRF